MRSTPQLSLVTPEVNPKRIIRKGKTPREGISTTVLGDSDNLHDFFFKTPIAASSSPIIPSVGVSRSLNFGSVPVEFSPSRPHLEEIFDTPVSPEIVRWFRPRSSEIFPTLGLLTPPPVIVVVFKEGGTYFPFSPRNTVPVSPVQTPSSPSSSIVHIPMEGANLPRNKRDAIVATRYAPLVLLQPMNPFPVGYYLKYMPKFTGEEKITTEDHLSSFYSYAYNLNIENEDVRLRFFIQNLDGEARK
jgi:hypothetical protein